MKNDFETCAVVGCDGKPTHEMERFFNEIGFISGDDMQIHGQSQRFYAPVCAGHFVKFADRSSKPTMTLHMDVSQQHAEFLQHCQKVGAA